jgi:hypothetical protein
MSTKKPPAPPALYISWMNDDPLAAYAVPMLFEGFRCDLIGIPVPVNTVDTLAVPEQVAVPLVTAADVGVP